MEDEPPQTVEGQLNALVDAYATDCLRGEPDEHSADDLIAFLRNNDCRTILSAAVRGDVFVEMFTDAAYYNHLDLVKVCVENGIDMDILSEAGKTALMYACMNNRVDVASYLLEHQADVNRQDDDEGLTALMHTVSFGHKGIIQLLLDHNADIDLKNNRGKTALDLTKKEYIKEILQNHVTSSYVLK